MENGAKLIVSIVLDNSASMKGDKIDKIKNAITLFDKKIAEMNLQNQLLYSISIFRGFDSICFKKYDQPLPDIENLTAGGIPLVNTAVNNSLDLLEKRAIAANAEGVGIFKPWVILLLNGENFDNVDSSAKRIVELIKSGRLTYFPFALSSNDFNNNLSLMRKIKPFTVVKDEMYDKLFTWIFDLAYKRITTPANQSFSIDPNSFEGWTIK